MDETPTPPLEPRRYSRRQLLVGGLAAGPSRRRSQVVVLGAGSAG